MRVVCLRWRRLRRRRFSPLRTKTWMAWSSKVKWHAWMSMTVIHTPIYLLGMTCFICSPMQTVIIFEFSCEFRRSAHPSCFISNAEQLLISVPFQQTIKLKSISFNAPEGDGSVHKQRFSYNWANFSTDGAPTTVKLFINQPSMDFSDAEDNVPTQVLELTSEDLKPDARTDLNYVKFQYVDHITVWMFFSVVHNLKHKLCFFRSL